jgi:hypothetical protein
MGIGCYIRNYSILLWESAVTFGFSLYLIVWLERISFMKKKKKFISIHSLNNLKSQQVSKWTSSKTKTIRVPIVLAEDLLKYAFVLDNFYGPNEQFYLIPINKVFLKLDKIYKSKKSLRAGIESFKKFLSLLIKEDLNWY